MNGNKILLDTNIVVYILSWNPDYIAKISEKEIFVSFITELEVLSYNFETKQDEQTATSFFEEVYIAHMDNSIKNLVIALKRTYKIKLPDCIILATSLAYSIDLVTNDLDLMNIYNRALGDSEILALYNTTK